MRLIALFFAYAISYVVKAGIPEQIYCPATPSVTRNLTEDDFIYHWHEVYEEIDNSFRAKKVCRGTHYTVKLNDTENGKVQAGLHLVKEFFSKSDSKVVGDGEHFTLAVDITLNETETV